MKRIYFIFFTIITVFLLSITCFAWTDGIVSSDVLYSIRSTKDYQNTAGMVFNNDEIAYDTSYVFTIIDEKFSYTGTNYSQVRGELYSFLRVNFVIDYNPSGVSDWSALRTRIAEDYLKYAFTNYNPFEFEEAIQDARQEGYDEGYIVGAGVTSDAYQEGYDAGVIYGRGEGEALAYEAAVNYASEVFNQMSYGFVIQSGNGLREIYENTLFHNISAVKANNAPVTSLNVAYLQCIEAFRLIYEESGYTYLDSSPPTTDSYEKFKNLVEINLTHILQEKDNELKASKDAFYKLELSRIERILTSFPYGVYTEYDSSVTSIKYENTIINSLNSTYDTILANTANASYQEGYNAGEHAGISATSMLKEGILSIASAPFTVLSGLLNFEILGINLYKIFTFILTLSLVAFLMIKLKGR